MAKKNATVSVSFKSVKELDEAKKLGSSFESFSHFVRTLIAEFKKAVVK